MKKISRTLLTVAAVAAVSASMAVSAAAMTAEYDAAKGEVTLGEITATGASQTLLVVAGENAEATEATIKQIDQKDDGTSFGTVTVGALADGTYEVRIGGNGTVQKKTFTVGAAAVETETITIGDADLKNGIQNMDATNILRYKAGYSTLVGQVGVERTKADGSGTITIGDADLKNGIQNMDATNVLRYKAGYTTLVGSVGTTVEVVK